MDAQVILCTLNRAAQLRVALGNLAHQEVPAGVAWQVLVVDNGSTDDTRAVIEEQVAAYPGRFRYLSEPRRGKSNALNTGIGASTAPILTFTDDDVEIDRGWLAAMLRAFEETGCAGVGGRILPKFPATPPDWLAVTPRVRQILGPLAEFDLGDERRPLTRAPYGGNVGYRRAALERHGGYRADLGPTDGNPMGRGEDVEIGDRLLHAGEVLMYAPDALVWNIIPPERMTRRYFASWWFHHGRATMRSDNEAATLPTTLGVPRYLFRSIGVSALHGTIARNGDSRLFHQLALAEHVGQAVQALQAAWLRRRT